MQSVTEKDQRIQHLENENKKLLEKMKLLEHNVEALTQALLQGSKKLFGRSSEKTPSEHWQASFLDKELTADTPKNDAAVVNIKEHKRPVRKKGDREKLTAF
ncbi:MAG: transposase, partial [Gammaproteobacteria bacterium]|nr:transposase [Gammaproteobacteria bacterium]